MTAVRSAYGGAPVTRALRRLPDGWVVFDDLAWPGRTEARIAHLVIGPGGAFVVDVQAWAGDVEVRDGVLTEDGEPREQAVDLAARAAIAVQGLVPTRCRPVLCLDRDEPVAGWAREVMICSTVDVVPMLRSLPRVLDPDDVRRCVHAVERSTKRSLTSRRPRVRRERAPVRVRPFLTFGATVALLGALLTGTADRAADWVGASLVAVVTPDDPPSKHHRHKKQRDEQRRQDRQR